jgi:hypothetical protein
VPGHIVHYYVDRQLFGKVFYKVHRAIDLPVIFAGRAHRRYNHDMVTATYIAKQTYPADERAVESAYAHILVDQLCTENPVFKKLLEQLAYAECARRKRARKSKMKEKKKRSRQKVSVAKESAFVSELRRLLGYH